MAFASDESESFFGYASHPCSGEIFRDRELRAVLARRGFRRSCHRLGYGLNGERKVMTGLLVQGLVGRAPHRLAIDESNRISHG